MNKAKLPFSQLLIPYVLSWVRVPLAVVFFFVCSEPWLAILVLLLTGLTDWLDGFLARRVGAPNAHGRVLDPAMDKVFVLVALVALLHHGYLEVFEAVFVLSRDLFTVALTLVCYPWIRKRMQIRSRPVGKLVTNLQFATILAALLRFAVTPFAVVTLVLSLLAIADYTWVFLRPKRSV